MGAGSPSTRPMLSRRRRRSTARPLAALAALGALLVATEARADTWAKTFVPAAVSTYVPANVGVLVVPADKSPQAVEAARALRAAVETTRPKDAVLDETALGPAAADLDDRALVQQAGALPVSAVGTVRVFPSGGRDSAVVTIYDRDGRVISAFTATKGTPLQPGAGVVNTVRLSEPPIAARGSMDMPALPALPPETDPERIAALNEAREEYRSRYVGLMNLAGGGDVMVPSYWPTPFRGAAQRALLGASFYEAIEQPVLAERFRAKRRLQVGLVGGGAAFAGLGLVTGLSIALATVDMPGKECTDFDKRLMQCFAWAPDHTGLAVGLTVIGFGVLGGLAVSLVGVFVNPHPITPDEARGLIDEYNKRLRREVGLEGRAERAAPPRFTWTIAPSVSPAGGGLSVAGRF